MYRPWGHKESDTEWLSHKYRASQVALAIRTNLPMQETLETWVRSLGWEDTLEEGTGTRSSILAWRLRWTEEPGEATVHGSHRGMTEAT